ncbi:MAG: hypothetical protein KatS3mg097_353 [Candidatus Parcubacteria bacterium]|nr:MAG: hypothetical protein KatS3mg097_353 [Candidatus Parcubacteria bacterium]
MQGKYSKLDSKKRYLQIALNSTLQEAQKIIFQLPLSDRILIEAGTPLIKRYGVKGIKRIKEWYQQHLVNQTLKSSIFSKKISKTFNLSLSSILEILKQSDFQIKTIEKSFLNLEIIPYVVADLKMMDRGETEVEIAAEAGADAVIALGCAPIESLNAFIQKCEDLGIDSMVDMMNVEFPLNVLRKLKKLPRVIILHRGVDEEKFNKEKQIPLYEIRRIKSNYDVLISIAGGDTLKEVQRAIFNDADIVIVWKYFYQSNNDIPKLAEEFLKEVT